MLAFDTAWTETSICFHSAAWEAGGSMQPINIKDYIRSPRLLESVKIDKIKLNNKNHINRRGLDYLRHSLR